MNASAKHRPNVLIEMPRRWISGRIASKVVQRVRDRSVDAHLEVQVRTEAAPGAARQADDLALADTLAQRDAERGLVGVAGGHRAGVLDAGEVAIATGGRFGLQQGDAPGRGGADRGAGGHADVDAGMAGLPGTPLAELRRDRAAHRPDERPAAALDRAGRQRALTALQRPGDLRLLGLEVGKVALELPALGMDVRERVLLVGARPVIADARVDQVLLDGRDLLAALEDPRGD